MRQIALCIIALALFSKSANAADFDGALPSIEEAVSGLSGQDYETPEQKDKARELSVRLAGMIRQTLIGATASDTDKVEAPLGILARPGESAQQELILRAPGQIEFPLSDVPQEWANSRLDLARDRLNEMLTFMDSGQMQSFDFKRATQELGDQLRAIYFPPQ